MNKAPRVRNQECQEPSGMSGMGWTTDPTCWAFPDNPDSRVSHRVEFSFFSISQVSSVLARVNQDCQDLLDRLSELSNKEAWAYLQSQLLAAGIRGSDYRKVRKALWLERGDRLLRSQLPRHAPGCTFHLDQYPWECDCGAAVPAGADKP